MRQLASIQRIISLSPIPNSDQIEVAKILGWNVVVRKGEFKVGDLCVYCEIDSLLPENNPSFDFLKDSMGRMKRIKTVRIRGQISQGIAFPLDVLKFHLKENYDGFCKHIKEGKDITNIIKVTKWEPDTSSHEGKKEKPSFVPTTDETRVEIFGDIISKYQGTMMYITEKLDGTSASYAIKEGNFYICHKKVMYDENDNNVHVTIAKRQNIKEKMKSISKNFVLQGEIVGPKIQKNKYRLDEPKFYSFQIYDIDNDKYVDYSEFLSICKMMNIATVPIISDAFELNTDVEGMVSMSNGISKLNHDVLREGIVVRPLKEIFDGHKKLHRGRLSFKCVNPEFLIKYNA